MTSNADEPLDDDPEATVGDTVPTPKPAASVDSLRELPEGETVVNPEFDGGDDPDATVVPDADASMTLVGDWAASLEDNAEPGHTIKAPAAVAPKKKRGSLEQTIALKRREVTQSANEQAADSSKAAEAHYQIEELLGEGGMGAVYAARQRSMDRPVASKVLKSRAARLASNATSWLRKSCEKKD